MGFQRSVYTDHDVLFWYSYLVFSRDSVSDQIHLDFVGMLEPYTSEADVHKVQSNIERLKRVCLVAACFESCSIQTLSSFPHLVQVTPTSWSMT